MDANDARIIVAMHEQILTERNYPPDIEAELRYYRAKFIPQKIRAEIGHADPVRPHTLKATTP